MAKLSLGKELLTLVHPIRSALFVDSADFNPNKHWPGTTWENLGCCVLMGCDPNDSRYNSPGTFAGENEHILTIDELPNHGHEVNFAPPNGNPDAVDGSGLQYGTKNGSSTGVLVKNTGGNQPHNNVQRSYLGYWWIRTS